MTLGIFIHRPDQISTGRQFPDQVTIMAVFMTVTPYILYMVLKKNGMIVALTLLQEKYFPQHKN